jgi:hypothetical protein
MEYVPSGKIKREIPPLMSSIKRNESRLTNLSKPISLIKELEGQSKELELRIEEAKTGEEKKLLSLELGVVKKRIDETKKIITVDLEKTISILRGVVEGQKEDLDLLNKKLEESVKYEEEIKIRKGVTICEIIDVTPFFPNTVRFTVKKGQIVEYLKSVDSNTTYLKVSTITNLESSNENPIRLLSVNYNTIFLNEGGRFTTDDSIKNPTTDIGNPIGRFGYETNYISQVINFDLDIVLNPSKGFIVKDINRNDGDLSVWVLSSSQDSATQY